MNNLYPATIPEFHIVSYSFLSPPRALDELNAPAPNEHSHQQVLQHESVELDAESPSGSCIDENDGHDSTS